MANSEGKIIWFNKQWFDFIGTTLQNMEKSGIKIVLHPDHVDKNIQFIQNAMEIRRFEGDYHWFLSVLVFFAVAFSTRSRIFAIDDSE